MVALLFTPTYVVAWQLWTSRLSAQRRTLALRALPPPAVLRVLVPGPRPPS